MSKYEVAGGVLETPEQGSIVLPPEQCGRKDIQQGELVIRTSETPQNLARAVAGAKQRGITEIPTERLVADETR